MMEQRQLAKELHAPARRRFPTRPVEIKGLNESWQADLIDFQLLKKWNKNVSFALIVIDNLSKKVYTHPLSGLKNYLS